MTYICGLWEKNNYVLAYFYKEYLKIVKRQILLLLSQESIIIVLCIRIRDV